MIGHVFRTQIWSKEERRNETDLSAEGKTEKERAWLQKENEHQERKKRFEEKKTERQESPDSIEAAISGLLYQGLLQEMKRPDIIRRKSDFDAVYHKGKSIGSRPAVVLYKKNASGHKRAAFVASKKVGNAVARNRARRLLKESYRELKEKLPEGFDYVFIARKYCAEKTTKQADVKKSIEAAMKKAGLLGKERNGKVTIK